MLIRRRVLARVNEEGKRVIFRQSWLACPKALYAVGVALDGIALLAVSRETRAHATFEIGAPASILQPAIDRMK